MKALDIISELDRYGGEVFVEDGALKLGIRHGCNVPDEIIEKARRYKADILAALRKPKAPAVWNVTVLNAGKPVSMTVIDPSHDPDDVFMRGLVDRFGTRLLTAKQR